MAFNIRDVKRGLLKDGSRESHFHVEIDLPPLMLGASPVAIDKISLNGKGTTQPSSNNVPVEVDYFGRKIKLAGNRTFEDWTVTFYNDETYDVKQLFENWLAAINGHENNVRQPLFGVDETQDSYKSYARVNQWSKTGLNIIKRYEMYGVFPVNVVGVNNDWGSNEVQTFDVTFSMDYWVNPELNDLIIGRVTF